MNENETIVISVGGSLLVPDDVDHDFIAHLRDFLLSEISNGKKFVLVCGGGKTARRYRDAMARFEHLKNEDFDELGIRATRINAYLLKKILNDIAHDEIILDPTIPIETDKPVIVAGGYKPGATSDNVAVLFAETINAKKVVNLSNIDHVYPYKEDGSLDRSNPYKTMSWEEFRGLMPEEHVSSANLPFDPIAAKRADELGIEVTILNGNALDELAHYLHGEEFVGTVIN